jgi:anaerobic magnesium-protoporphyrin IX monomethyl ester cyclase
MRIALVQPNNITYRGTLCPPLGLMHVGAVARYAGHDVKIFDRNHEIRTLQRLRDYKPDVVGITTFTGPMISDALLVTNFVKKKMSGHIPVVWGGIHPTLMPEQTMSCTDIDYVVRGEELAFPRLLDAIEGKRSFEDVRGIAYRKNGNILLTPEQDLIENLDALPMLPWDLVDAKKYLDLEIVLVTSRGCPFKCAFCYNRKFNRSRWRTFSINRIIKEIQTAESITNTRLIKFHDDNFAVSKKRMLAILDYLSPRYSINIEVRAREVKDDLLSRLRKFKRSWVFIGVETGSERLLKHMAKDLSLDDIRSAYEKMHREESIFTVAAVIVGLPTETRTEFLETLRLLDELDSTWPSVQIYTPFPGSRYYDEWEAAGGEVPKSLIEWTQYAPDIGKTGLTGQKTLSYDPHLLKRLNWKYTFKMVKNCVVKGDIPKLLRRLRDVSALKAMLYNKIEQKRFGINIDS